MKKEKTFRECRLSWLEGTFGLDQANSLPSLTYWLSEKVELENYERESLIRLQRLLTFNVRDWYEAELDSCFIGPVMALVEYSTKKSNIFSDRSIESMVGDWRLYGRPDSFLASGRREPVIPFFAFQEYKKMTDPAGSPLKS